jgi:hypothetical protein
MTSEVGKKGGFVVAIAVVLRPHIKKQESFWILVFTMKVSKPPQ